MDFQRPKDYMYVTKHEFKNNISKILRILDKGSYQGAVITHYRTKVALVVSMSAMDERRARRAEGDA